MQRSLKEEVKYLEGKLSKNENSILFARLADAYLQMDRIDDAIELCEKGMRKHPYYVTGHYVLGKCYIKKKLFDQAEKELKRVLLFDPKYIAAHRDYGDLMAQIGWHNTGEMSYKEILRIDPFNEAARKRLEELRQPPLASPANPPELPIEQELEEAEEDLLTEFGSAPEKGTELSVEPEKEPEFDLDRYAESLQKKEPQPAPQAPSDLVDEIKEFQDIEPESDIVEPEAKPAPEPALSEAENAYEDDKANLDMLEDIFRDDEWPDVLVDEDMLDQSFEDENGSADPSSQSSDQNYLYGEEYKFDSDGTESKEIDGLNDEEVFALIGDDEQVNKPIMKSPLDISRPAVRREPAPVAAKPKETVPDELSRPAEPEPPLTKTLIEIQRETRPRFEPQLGKAALQKQQEEKGSKTADLNDSQRKKEKIVTPTLGEIYAAQHQYAKAIGVYEILRRKEPDNELYNQKIEYLQKKLEESQSE